MSFMESDGVLRSFSDLRPSHFIKPLHSFSLLLKEELLWNNPDGELEFEDFEAGGYQWKLVLYPNGNKKKDVEQHISLYLVMAGENSLQPGWDVYVDFRLFLLDQRKGKYVVFEDVFTKNFCFRREMIGGVGFDKLISLDDFTDVSNGYLVDDTCIFGAEVFVCKETRPPKVCHSIIKPTSETYKHVCKIPDFSSMADDEYFEDPFTAGGRKWILQLCPGGFNSGLGTHVSIYLELDEPLPEGITISTDYTVCILDQNNHSKHLCATIHHCFVGSQYWGWDEFITLENFRAANRGFVKNDTCIIEVEITMNGIVMVPCALGGKKTIKQEDVIVHRTIQASFRTLVQSFFKNRLLHSFLMLSPVSLVTAVLVLKHLNAK